FPSRTEGFGLPPLEAMTLGCPVIAAPCGALPETCGDAAVYVEPDDVEGWVRAIGTIVEAPEAARAAGDRGQAHAAKFAWSQSAQKLLGVIQEVQARLAGDR